MDDVAYLFVEQYENLHGLYTEEHRKSEVDLIRRAADKGESALYTVVASIFGEGLNDAMVGAANGAIIHMVYRIYRYMTLDAVARIVRMFVNFITMSLLLNCNVDSQQWLCYNKLSLTGFTKKRRILLRQSRFL